MGNPPDHATRDISSKFLIFLPLRAIKKNHITMRHPVLLFKYTLSVPERLRVLTFEDDATIPELHLYLENLIEREKHGHRR